MPLLEVRQLTKYFGGLAALGDVDLDVIHGEILGVIGPNGAGKTTLLNVITGVLRPSKGKIILHGRNVAGLKPHQMAQRRVVRTFQSSILFGEATVEEHVMAGYHLHRKTGLWQALFNTSSYQDDERRTREKAKELLEFAGLLPWKNALARSLPHGYQRTLGVATALSANPELLLLDEPMTGMNPEETATMVARINSIRDMGITLVLVEHHMKAVMEVCDRIVVLNYGRKIAEGLPSEIKENRTVIEAYLGSEEI